MLNCSLFMLKYAVCWISDGWSAEYGSAGDVGGLYDGGFDSGSYENNNFGWDDK